MLLRDFARTPDFVNISFVNISKCWQVTVLCGFGNCGLIVMFVNCYCVVEILSKSFLASSVILKVMSSNA